MGGLPYLGSLAATYPMTKRVVDIQATVPGTDPAIIVRLRPYGGINIHTDVQRDYDNLEVRTPEEWDAIVGLVAELQRAQAAALDDAL